MTKEMTQELLIRILENEDTSVSSIDLYNSKLKVGPMFVSSLHNALVTTVCQRKMEDFEIFCHSKKNY